MNTAKPHSLKVVSGPSPDPRIKRSDGLESRSDEEIWSRFKTGDEAAFIYIYQKYFDRLVNYCYQFTKNEDLIKDCIQDLFIFLRHKRESISGTNNISLYLLKSCRNRLIDYLKKELKVKSLEDSNAPFFIPVLSTEENIINLQTREIKVKRLLTAIKKLSLREREIIYYFYFEDLDYKSISELMGYEHVKSVRSLLYKALTKLKDVFVFVLVGVYC